MNHSTLIQQLRSQFAGSEWPLIDNLQAAPQGWQLSLSIPADRRWLEGHFPQQPLVAGVVQTHWAACLAQALFPVGDAFMRVDNLKFQQVILPEQPVELVLEHLPAAEQQAVKFCYSHNDLIFSEGKLVFNARTAQ